MPPEIVYRNGFCSFAREAGDQMGWEGMVEIYLCLMAQYPTDNRENPPNLDKQLYGLMKKYKLNRYEFANILATFTTDTLGLWPDERYPHY